VNTIMYVSFAAIIVIFVIGLIWIVVEPSSPPIPKEGRERMVWQAEHGNRWAQTVLLLQDGQDHLFAIVEGYKEVVADAGIEITRDNPAHIKLDDAQDELHNWIARTFNKEEC